MSWQSLEPTPMESQSSKAREGFSCLIVEDDEGFASMVGDVVRDLGGAPTWCGTLRAAMEVTEGREFDLVLMDNHLPDGKGYDFHAQFSRRNPEAPIVMITGAPDLCEAVTLTRNGLFDYLTKPVDTGVLVACLERALQRIGSRGDFGVGPGIWWGQSPVMREVMQQVEQVGRHGSATVLVTGESGTGKDIIARMLHRLTHEGGADAPYVPVNCAAVPAEMFEAELFGAEKGAYTGADRQRAGLVGAANGGTLFLDEIGEVPLALQAKLLRFLEDREYRPLGSTTTRPFGGRFVAATNKLLREEVRAGRFREDLLFRIEVFCIELPPLRRRQEDIPGMAEFLLDQLAERYGRKVPQIKPEDISALKAHVFPGNVRELRNLMERSLLRTPEGGEWLAFNRDWLLLSDQEKVPSTAVAARPIAGGGGAVSGGRADLTPLEAQEYALIRETLRETGGAIRKAAVKLGLSPQALLRRLEKWPELRDRSQD